MDYQRVAEPGEGLRLHLNENTAGCSPKVLEAIRAIGATQISFYPDYAPALAACADLFGVALSRLALVNGLDEGIWATASACIRAGDAVGEAIVPEPTFDMYGACVRAVGGRVTAIPPGPGFRFPIEEVQAAIGPATRVVYLCSPNNPTGLSIAREHVSAIARTLPRGALVFLDEAYVDFGSRSFLPLLDTHDNVVVGRTFAKAYGLAALRIGCLIAQPAALSVVQRAIPPYSLNACAIEGVRAAIADREYHDWYCAQVTESRELIYENCARFGLTCWRSDANFVLVHAGDRSAALVQALAARGVFIRDRTGEPGCTGCVRITAGVVEHTRICLAAMEEVLCAEE
ncbi:MAG TPA: histidinol-phosphate transaminase [Vicinamibacterales bacterium]|jgi:histidinol-phosphate aminotransferase